MALGAGQWRIIRQLVTEGLPLAMLGGALGIAICWAGMNLFLAVAPADFPRLDKIALDRRVLAFTVLMVVLTALLFAVIPALQAARAKVAGALKELGRGAAGGLNRQRMRSVLVTGQIALALVLLIGAGLMIHSFVDVIEKDLGADPRNLLTFEYRLTMNETVKPFGRYRGMGLWDISPVPAQRFEQVLDRLQQLPGVVSVAAGDVPPFGNVTFRTMPFFVEGDTTQQTAEYFAVTRGFFGVMKTSVIEGRDFNDRDTATAPLVMIINETMRRRYFPSEDPIGKRVTLDWVPDERPREIIGVVRDMASSPMQKEQMAAMYVPHLQQPSKWTGPNWYSRSGMYFVIRTAGDAMTLLPAVKSAVAEVDRGTPVAEARTVQETLDNQVRNLRLYMLLLAIFGAVATILAAIGIYGVMAYSVAERTREIGIRMALGGSTQDVLVIVLREATWLVSIGLVLGLAGAFALRRVLESALFTVTATDPVTYAAVSLFLVLIAGIACFIPAHRATTVDPTIALKYE